YGNHRLRYVSPDGTIRTAAGGGATAPGTTASPGQLLAFTAITALAVERDGNLDFSDASDVYHLDAAGFVTRIAGTGSAGATNGEGIAATTANLNYVSGLAVARDGSIFI